MKPSSMNLLKVLIFFFLSILLLVYSGFLCLKPNLEYTNPDELCTHEVPKHVKETEKENLLDQCYHVYLDVGSNIGIQIRKLFEPSKYPDAAVHSIFDLNFGTFKNRFPEGKDKKVCAIGFEPNFQHTPELTKLEKTYNGCGWKVKIFTETAVSDHNGEANFYFSRYGM